VVWVPAFADRSFETVAGANYEESDDERAGAGPWLGVMSAPVGARGGSHPLSVHSVR